MSELKSSATTSSNEQHPPAGARQQHARHVAAAAPLPLCRYFLIHGSCLNDPAVGGNCRFSHMLPRGKTLDEVRKETVCPFLHGKGKRKCRFGDKCIFSHDGLHVADAKPSKAASDKNKRKGAEGEDEGEPCCGVCLEVPPVSDAPSKWARYALLPGCDHAFCVSCLKQWRAANKNKKNRDSSGSDSYHDNDNRAMVKCCPTCRAPSRFCVPSNKFYRGKEKDAVITAFVDSKKNKPCSQYSGPGTCPFGSECFYAHLDQDGNDVKAQDDTADVLFQRREAEYQQRRTTRRRRRRRRMLGINDEEEEMILMRGFMSLLSMFGEDGEDGDWTEVDPDAAALALEAMGIPIPMPFPASVMERSGDVSGGPDHHRSHGQQGNRYEGRRGNRTDSPSDEEGNNENDERPVNVD